MNRQKLLHKKKLHLSQRQHSAYFWSTIYMVTVQSMYSNSALYNTAFLRFHGPSLFLIYTYISICWQIIDCPSKAIFFPGGITIIISRVEIGHFPNCLDHIFTTLNTLLIASKFMLNFIQVCINTPCLELNVRYQKKNNSRCRNDTSLLTTPQ